MRDRYIITWSIAAALLLFVVPLQAADKAPAAAPSAPAAKSPPAAANVDPLEPIRQASRDFAAAFNRGDAKAIAALWTEDGDFIDDTGRLLSGRAAIEKEYTEFFAEHGGHKMTVIVDALRLLSPDAAIEDGRAMLDPPPPGAPAISKYTAVHVKVGGKWLMSTVRDTHVETPSTYKNLAELEWMIGTWIGEEEGVRSEVECRWIGNKSFIQRTYQVTSNGHKSMSGTQVIGWNPQTGRIQSWNFAADGGHAIGVWMPREGGWAVDSIGTLADGTPTTGLGVLTRLDDDAFAWQATRRTAGGITLPDTSEYILKRARDKAPPVKAVEPAPAPAKSK